METVTLSHRDQAVLRAVAEGRCRLSGRCLLVDGVYCADQFAGRRLVAAGLITDGGALTASAEHLLPTQLVAELHPTKALHTA